MKEQIFDLKQDLTYTSYWKAILSIACIALLWVSPILIYNYASSRSFAFYEINEIEEEKTVKEKSNQKEYCLFSSIKYNLSKRILAILLSEKTISIHHPEVATPPPRPMFVFFC